MRGRQFMPRKPPITSFVANNIVAKERFRYFIKVPELAQFYSEITDYRTGGYDRHSAPKERDILQHTSNPAQEGIRKLHGLPVSANFISFRIYSSWAGVGGML